MFLDRSQPFCCALEFLYPFAQNWHVGWYLVPHRKPYRVWPLRRLLLMKLINFKVRSCDTLPYKYPKYFQKLWRLLEKNNTRDTVPFPLVDRSVLCRTTLATYLWFTEGPDSNKENVSWSRVTLRHFLRSNGNIRHDDLILCFGCQSFRLFPLAE